MNASVMRSVWSRTAIGRWGQRGVHIGLALAVCFGLGWSPAQAEKRVALVIGNSAYRHATELPNPSRDARAVAAKLKAARFNVISGLDLDRRGFDVVLRDFSRKVADADVALLFYAGHGLQVSGRNYLVPIDAKLEHERDLDFETVRLDFVMAQMEMARQGKTTLVFLDACRNNPLSRNLARSMGRTRSAALGRGLAPLKSGVGSFISFSTQPNNVAVDGDGQNSPYAAALIRHMPAKGVPLTGLMINVRKDVIKATDGAQVPWDHSALTGQFYFHPGERDRAAGAKTADLSAMAKRLKDLEAAMNTRTSGSGDDGRRYFVESRIADLEKRIQRDQRTIRDLQREMLKTLRPRKRLEVHKDLSHAMRDKGETARELRDLRNELAQLTGADTPNLSEARDTPADDAQRPDKTCLKLAPGASDPIPLKPGARLCSGAGDDTAEVVRIANRAVAFRVKGREFTCMAGQTCQFDWARAPLFTISAQADATRGIAPSGQLLPR